MPRTCCADAIIILGVAVFGGLFNRLKKSVVEEVAWDVANPRILCPSVRPFSLRDDYTTTTTTTRINKQPATDLFVLLLFGFITVIFCLLCFFFSFLFRVKKRLKSVKDKDKFDATVRQTWTVATQYQHIWCAPGSLTLCEMVAIILLLSPFLCNSDQECSFDMSTNVLQGVFFTGPTPCWVGPF